MARSHGRQPDPRLTRCGEGGIRLSIERACLLKTRGNQLIAARFAFVPVVNMSSAGNPALNGRGTRRSPSRAEFISSVGTIPDISAHFLVFHYRSNVTT